MIECMRKATGISIDERVFDWAKAQAKAGKYSFSIWLENLIEAEMKRQAQNQGDKPRRK